MTLRVTWLQFLISSAHYGSTEKQSCLRIAKVKGKRKRKGNVDLYIVKPLRRSGIDHTVLLANNTMPAFTK